MRLPSLSLKVSFFLFASFLFLFTIASSIHAQVLRYEPPREVLNGTHNTVTVNTSTLDTEQEYKICWRAGDGDIFGCQDVPAGSESYSVTLCGAGPGGLKKDCGGGDYFHEGNTYVAWLTHKDDDDPDGIDAAQIYINYYIPDATVSSSGGQIYVNVTGLTKPGGGARNNYTIDIRDDNGDEVGLKCMQINGTPKSFDLDPGRYKILIYDQKADSGVINNSSCSTGGRSTVLREIFIEVDDVGNVKIIKNTADPNGENKTLGSGRNPCQEGVCPTAFGNFATSFKAFANNFLKVALGLAGGIALILMVFGSIRVLTSSGDQQRLNAGREVIIAAVVGLLFIIFSTLILEFIGIKIIGL